MLGNVAMLLAASGKLVLKVCRQALIISNSHTPVIYDLNNDSLLSLCLGNTGIPITQVDLLLRTRSLRT